MFMSTIFVHLFPGVYYQCSISSVLIYRLSGCLQLVEILEICWAGFVGTLSMKVIDTIWWLNIVS